MVNSYNVQTRALYASLSNHRDAADRFRDKLESNLRPPAFGDVT
jgi:hypothetical protein